MTTNITLHALRREMRRCREQMSPGDLCDYFWGRFSGLSVAAKLLVDDDRHLRCPDCKAMLPGDGSCCDECGWVLAADGERMPT